MPEIIDQLSLFSTDSFALLQSFTILLAPRPDNNGRVVLVYVMHYSIELILMEPVKLTIKKSQEFCSKLVKQFLH